MEEKLTKNVNTLANIQNESTKQIKVGYDLNANLTSNKNFFMKSFKQMSH